MNLTLTELITELTELADRYGDDLPTNVIQCRPSAQPDGRRGVEVETVKRGEQ